MIPILDVVLLGMSAYFAFANAGTIIGWVMTIAVFVQTFTIVKFIRET